MPENTNKRNVPVLKLRKSKWTIGLVAIVVITGILVAAKVHVRFGRFADDKAAADAAENAMIRQYNERNFDAIYDSASDALKSELSRAQVTDAMKQTFDKYGVIGDDSAAATTCFPYQVRMVRWMKAENGTELTALVTWFVPDGKHAMLVSAQISPGHSSFNPDIVRAHSCS
ncbi:DUF3887 domain-containing protein [Paraburkholderia edwinii]|uniref:DUF3887 domain-containing protein n=1 Tax=Paraburkholderia edwinii TaxID=2861782 RepID=A0ABX8UMN6_9BURK|nr:DUF3887 domain-containing protein [Paraburkholderia edwinii]QYD68243.1 DUF3887 domain-containing protein [Paraburkholderia edwinii]